MLRKKIFRPVAIALLIVFMFSTVAMAATPNNTIFFGDKAYNLSLLKDPTLASEIVAAFVANGNKFVYKTPGGSYIDINANSVDPATIPAGTYMDADKETVEYGAGDTEPVQGLEVVEVSAIDANTLLVKFAGEGAPAEAVKIPLTTALEDGQTKVTFIYEEVEYTGILDEAWVAPFEGELAVVEVSAIETTFVEVTFDALAEALTDVTVEVKNSEEEVVEVVAQDLAAGATSAQFDFVKAVSAADLTGVWTVDGVEYSFDELELVADIVTASALPVNEIELLALLNKAGIQNIDEDRLSAYAAEIVAEGPVKFVDVQKNIDDVNEDAAEASAEEAVVKAVVDATNQIQLKAALEANFDRVNPDWIPNYAVETVNGTGMLALVGPANYFGTPTTGVDADMIQAAIDQANNDVIFAAVTGLDATAATSADQAKVTAAIQAWIEDDVAPATTKADAVKDSQIKEAAFRVAEATTENSLYNALVAYANITPDATLKASELNANLKAEYKTILDVTGFKATLVAAIQGGTEDIKATFATAADSAALTAAMGDVATTFAAVNGAPTDATKLAGFKAALQEVADVTSHKTGTAKFDMTKVSDALLADYATEFAVATAITSGSTVVELQGKITTVNDAEAISVALDVVNDEDATLAEVRAALIDIAIEVTGGTTGDDFIDLSKQAQLEVAELVVDARPAAGYANLDAIILPADGTGALATAMGTHAAEFAKFNAIGDLATATTTSVKTELDTYAYDEYEALTNTEKIAVANEIKGLTKMVGDVVTPLDFGGADAVETLAEANAIIDAAIAAIK